MSYIISICRNILSKIRNHYVISFTDLQAEWLAGFDTSSNSFVTGLYSVTSDENNNAYACGAFPFINGAVINIDWKFNRNNGPMSFNQGGGGIGLIGKWNSSGIAQWMAHIGSTGTGTPLTKAYGIDYASDYVYVSGSYQDSPLYVYGAPNGTS
jgi:hypothetical protein